jgi:hypothetical protein
LCTLRDWAGCVRPRSDRDSLTELPITHKALSRWVIALLIRVKVLNEVVATAKELAQSPLVVEPREVSTSPAVAVLLRVDARGHRGAHEQLREGLQVMAWQTRRCVLRRLCEVTIGPRGIVQPVRPRRLGRCDAHL